MRLRAERRGPANVLPRRGIESVGKILLGGHHIARPRLAPLRLVGDDERCRREKEETCDAGEAGTRHGAELGCIPREMQAAAKQRDQAAASDGALRIRCTQPIQKGTFTRKMRHMSWFTRKSSCMMDST